MVLVWVLSICYLVTETKSVPPEACFANFRWDDCGKTPVAVMYYWKPGSRCEVAYWRGCLPNPNMFKDEYECIDTCIFTARAQEHDSHKIVEYPSLNDTMYDSDLENREAENGENRTSNLNTDIPITTNSPDNATGTEEITTLADGTATDGTATHGTATHGTGTDGAATMAMDGAAGNTTGAENPATNSDGSGPTTLGPDVQKLAMNDDKTLNSGITGTGPADNAGENPTTGPPIA